MALSVKEARIAAKSTLWIYHPALDLIVGCGAWSLPLLMAAYWFSQSAGLQMSIAFYALTLFFNNPHYSATIYRAYHRREDFSKYKRFTLHITALLAATAVLAHWSAWMLPWLYTVYLTWSPWHYAGQNFGLAMMFIHRAEARPTKTERNSLYLASLGSYLMLFIAFHTGQSSDPLLISLGLPEGPARAARWLLLVVFFASTLSAFVKLIGRAGLRQMLAPAALMATQFLWFVLPTMLELLSLYEVPQARYSTGILAILHSAQYLWITSYYAKRESLSSLDGRWRPFGYFAALIIGGIALFVPGPWFVSYVFKQDFSSSFLIFASLINIHHFILDGAVWKLRDPGVAENLLDKKEPAQSSQKNFSTSGAMRWVFGTRFSARALRIAAVVLLIALAGLDQAKFYLGASDSDLSRLARAEALNPYDSQVLTHKARAWSREGNLEERLASLRRAVRINPRNRQAQTTLAQALIENKRFEEAYEHYKQMARNIKADSGMYFNMGVLASQLGRDSEAIEHWKKSVALDNRNSMAHLRLAEAYDLRRAYASAIEHNEQYLLLLTSNREQDAPDVESVLRVVLKLAEEYTFTEQNDRAISYYEKMATLGEKSGGLHYSSLAWSRQASLYAQMNEKNKAARCYQRALLIDAELRDAKVEGADWFNYGRFLKQSKASEQLSLACILKAEQLLDSASSDETGAARREREAMEKSLGSEAEAVRREMELLLKEAMAFQF